MIKRHFLAIKFGIFFLLFAGANSMFSQNKNAQLFFAKPDLMSIGVYYYPEQWDKKDWERDLTNIKKLGFEFTHFAEFAWTFLEPRQGQFDFKWLDDALGLAEKAGLKVILCTPSACPPAWMGEKYPEVYLVDESGRRREHGNRANQSVTNEVYNSFVDRIVTELAKRYGNNKNIMGWQWIMRRGRRMISVFRHEKRFKNG